jgi:ABC-2 type transport system ATP-binding protein
VALAGVDVEVTPGRVTSVVGGDGAGKTTMARLLVGLLGPSAGRVRRPERRRIGYQSEASGVWPDLTVTENLVFAAVAHRLLRADRDQRMAFLLEVTRLGEARARLASQLSGGMRQKLGVAMALLPRPDLLVLDEPTTGLDPVSRAEVWTVVAEATAQGTAVLATTTYVDEAERGTTVVALDDGRVIAQGTVAEVRAALPGVVAVVADDVPARYRWRRHGRRLAWFADGPPPGAETVEPDLTDLLTVAALRSRP